MPLNISDENKKKVLVAADSGDLSTLKKAAKELDKGKGMKETIEVTKDATGRCPLHLAAAHGRMNICRYLIEELGFAPHLRSDRGETPLRCAAAGGRTETVRYLIDAGADPNLADAIGNTPLLFATGEGHCEVVELLLSRGAVVDPENYLGTPLFVAAMFNREGTMEILLEHNADVNWAILDILTPLKLSIDAGSLNCTRLLVKAGADVNFKAPVVDASEKNSVEFLKCLLDAGADPNIPDKYGRFAIEAAAMSGNKGIVQMLFPLTFRVPTVPDWTVEGIYSYVNSEAYKKKYEGKRKKYFADLKRRANDAFRQKDYYGALYFYYLVPQKDATVCANLSLCWLHLDAPQLAMKYGEFALTHGPDWPEAYYRLGAALMALKKYEQASQVLFKGFELDPEDKSIEKALWEAMEGMKKAHI